MEYTSSDEEEPYDFSPNEVNYEATNQNWYQEDYGESCRTTDYSGSYFEGELYGDELEPEPPDRYTMSHSYKEPCANMPQNVTTWTETNSYFGEQDDNANYHYHPPGREEKSHHYRVASYRVQTQSTPAAPKKKTKKRCEYTSNPLIFTGSSKDPEVYLRWETNMKQWLRSNNIPKEEKLYYALSKLEGDAYKWWLREDAATYCTTKQVLDWGALKSRMYREFTKKYQPRNHTTKHVYQATSRNVMSTPNLQPVRKQKFLYCPEPKNVISNTLTKQTVAKQSVRVKEVQQKSISTPILEPQGTSLQCKTSKTLSELTCYRCHKRGHIAATCPARKIERSTPLESKAENNQTVKLNFEISNSSVMHLSLPKVIDSGNNVGVDHKEATCEPNPSCREEPSQLSHLVSYQKIVSAPTNEKVQAKLPKSDSNDPMNDLIHFSYAKIVEDNSVAKEKTNLNLELDPKEKRKIISPPKDMIQTEMYPFIFGDSMTVLTHLSSVQKAENVSGTKEIKSDQGGASKITKGFSDQILDHEESTPTPIRLETTKGDGDTSTCQLKEEPPDVPHIIKLSPYQGKTLDSKN